MARGGGAAQGEDGPLLVVFDAAKSIVDIRRGNQSDMQSKIC